VSAPALQEKKKILGFALVSSCLLAAVSLLLKRSDWAAGVVLGTAAGLVNFYFLFHNLSRISGPAKSPGSLTARFFVRYLFLASVFFLAFRCSWIHFLSFVLGFFLVHLSLGVVSLIRLIRSAK